MAGASGNVRAGRAFVELMLDQTRLERGLKAAQSKLKRFGTSVMSMGTRMLGMAALAGAPLAMASKTFADFDDQMRMVKAVTGLADAEFRAMTETAERLGRETSFTAKQVAEGMTSLGRMGFSAGEINAAIPAVLDLARATGTELGEAAEIAANNMRVFGIASSDMAKVSDILTATANGSAQTLTDLAEGLKMAGPQAAAAGDDIRNVAASLGVLANMGIKGSLAGTALRRAYSQFANLDVRGKLAELNIATVNGNGNLRSMPAIMADIARAMNTMPSARKLAFAEEIFDLRGSLAGLQLGGNIDQLNEFIRMLGNVDGTARNTAKEMDAGIGGALRRLQSAFEGVQISVGRILGEAIAPYMDRISAMLNRLAEWAKAHCEVIVTIAKVIGIVAAAGAALAALGVAFKAIAFAVGTLNTLFTVMKVAVLAPIGAVRLLIGAHHLLTAAMAGTRAIALACWAAMSSPAFLVGAALAGLVAIVWNLTGAWDICKDAISGFWGDCTAAFSDIGEVFGETWECIRTAIGSGDLAGAARVGLAALKLIWLKGIFPLKKAWLELKNLLADSWTVVVYGILKLGNNLWYGLLTGLTHIGDGIADAWAGIWNGVVDVFQSTCEWLERQWVKFKGVFDGNDAVNAALLAVEQKYANSRDERERQFAAAVNGRREKRAALSREWDSSSAAIDQAQAQAVMENLERYSSMIDDVQARIGEATAEWRDAMDAVRRTAEERVARAEEARGRTADAARGTRQAAERAGLSADRGGERSSAGSWSLRELKGMFGNSDFDQRTANASESSVRLQQETNRYLRKMSAQALTYGG
ncbi:MAG: phage tail tape measure protein [Oligosphaeraceae bacterium]